MHNSVKLIRMPTSTQTPSLNKNEKKNISIAKSSPTNIYEVKLDVDWGSSWSYLTNAMFNFIFDAVSSVASLFFVSYF